MANASAKYTISAEDKTKQTLKNIKRGFGDVDHAVGAVKASLVGLVGAGGFGLMIKSAVDTADQIQKLSTRLGASSEALSEYQHVAELSGVSFNTLTMGLQRMTRRVAEAAQGTGEARGALKELNLSAAELSQLAPEDQFERIAEAISGVGSDSDKVRLAMKLFDSEGVSLLQTMTDGADGIARMREEANKLGLTLSKDQVNAAADAKDAMTQFNAAATGLGRELTLGLAPVLTKIIRQLSVGLPLAVNGLFDILTTSDTEALDDATRRMKSLSDSVALHSKMLDDFKAKHPGLSVVIAGKQQTLDELRAKLQGARADVESLMDKINNAAPTINITPGAQYTPPDIGDDLGRKDLDRLTDRLMTEEEAIAESYLRRDDILSDAWERGLITDQRYEKLQEKSWSKHQKDLAKIAITETAKRTRYTALLESQSFDSTLTGLKELTAGVDRHSRTAFEINKAASIAESTMNAYTAFNKALAQGGLWGAAKAAAIFATGMANVRAIASTSFGGAGGSSPSTVTGADTTITPNDEPALTPDDITPRTQGTQITIRVDGNVYESDNFRNVIVEAIEAAQTNDEIRLLNYAN